MEQQFQEDNYQCASQTLRPRCHLAFAILTSLDNQVVCDGGSWGASTCLGTGQITTAQLRTYTDATQWRPFLGATQRTSRACLRRDSEASETAWQIWAWPPRRQRKGANWIYIFVFNPPYMLHWFNSSSECRLHVCIGTEKYKKK